VDSKRSLARTDRQRFGTSPLATTLSVQKQNMTSLMLLFCGGERGALNIGPKFSPPQKQLEKT
jgi:hypothetical protein